MRSYGMPHKANTGDIIAVKQYPGQLFLVEDWSEEIVHTPDFEEENVTYTCLDIDDSHNIRIFFDPDVSHVVVHAENADDFLESRQKNLGHNPPAIHKPMFEDPIDFDKPANPQDIMNLAIFFGKMKDSQEEEKAKKPRSEHERLRLKEEEDREYIDYLLDVHSMLRDLNGLVGDDATRLEEMRMIEAEFHDKTAKLSNGNSR